MFRLAAVCPLAAALLVSMLALPGCQQPIRPNQLAEAGAALNAGRYDEAYRDAVQVARQRDAAGRDEAALIAGLAARRNARQREAERWLLEAAFSEDRDIAGDALATLGLMYAEHGRHADSAQALLGAAGRLQGQERANAYFYAAIAQQKLEQWAQARTNLTLARQASSDPAFRQRVDEQLAVVGYTLQLGAFEDRANAERLAEDLRPQAREARLGVPRVASSTGRDGSPLSVVQVGQFSTFESAMQARDRLGRREVVIVPLTSPQ